MAGAMPVEHTIRGTDGHPSIGTYTSAVVNCAAGATTAVIAAPGAGKQIWIYGLKGAADTAAGIVTIEDSGGTDYSGAMAVSDEGHIPAHNLSGLWDMPHYKLATNKGLSITTVGCTLTGSVQYATVTL